jgi:hypothetical protein
MVRILLGLTLLTVVGAGSYYLGARRTESKVQEPQPLVDASLLIPETAPELARQTQAVDPVMFKMIENHFKEQADWKLGQ